jgi:hypothetical protein
MNKEIMNEVGGHESPSPITKIISLNKLMRLQHFERDELKVSDFCFEEADNRINDDYAIKLSQNRQFDRYHYRDMNERAAQLEEKKYNFDFRENPNFNPELRNPEEKCKEIVLNFSD